MLGKCYLHMCQYVHWLEAFLYGGREFPDYVLWQENGEMFFWNYVTMIAKETKPFLKTAGRRRMSLGS